MRRWLKTIVEVWLGKSACRRSTALREEATFPRSSIDNAIGYIPPYAMILACAWIGVDMRPTHAWQARSDRNSTQEFMTS
jgi:hypothetical protein